jgi:hypothetical protein
MSFECNDTVSGTLKKNEQEKLFQRFIFEGSSRNRSGPCTAKHLVDLAGDALD